MGPRKKLNEYESHNEANENNTVVGEFCLGDVDIATGWRR